MYGDQSGELMQIMGLLALKGLKLAPKPPDYKDQILSIYMH